MTNLTDVNIKELLKKSNEDLRSELEAMLPKPTHPEHLLGRWAKHPEYGDVVCAWDKPRSGEVKVYRRYEGSNVGAHYVYVHVSELTFPEQTTKPEDVPVGEAWLVNVDGKHSGERVVALKFYDDHWYTGDGVVDGACWWMDEDVTLIAPLVPARPEPEPEPEPEHPRTLSSVEDYEAAPVGTTVASSDNNPWTKICDDEWMRAWSGGSKTNSAMAALKEQDVLRWGWGNE